jgi:hypothetical protein
MRPREIMPSFLLFEGFSSSDSAFSGKSGELIGDNLFH